MKNSYRSFSVEELRDMEFRYEMKERLNNKDIEKMREIAKEIKERRNKIC